MTTLWTWSEYSQPTNQQHYTDNCWLDLRIAALDGTDTLYRRRRQHLAGQVHKKGAITNTIWLTDRQKNVGGSNCAYNKHNTKYLDDNRPFPDELMYQERFVVERTNAWMDAFRLFLNRFDVSIASWTAWHYIFAIVSCSKALKEFKPLNDKFGIFLILPIMIR